MAGYAGKSVGLLLALLPAGRGLAAAVRRSPAAGASAQPAAPLRGLRYKVVVNTLCEQPWIAREQLSRLFLKKTVQWACGDGVAAVDQGEASLLRARFSEEVHRKSVKAVKAYWRHEIFSAQEVPPPEKSSDAEVLDFVREHPSAIGYVSGEAPTAGVRVLEVRP